MDGERLTAGPVRVVLAQDGSQKRKGMDWPACGATEADLAIINALPGVLTPLAADDVFVRGVYAVNDLPLMGKYRGLRIRSEGVQALASMASGVPIQFMHDPTKGRQSLPTSRVFKADTVFEDGATWMRTWVYFPAVESNAELVNLIDSGGITEASVGAGFKRVRCGICGADAGDCKHAALNIYNGRECLMEFSDPALFEELSLVTRGAAQGTHFFMAAARGLDDVAKLVKGDGREINTLDAMFEKPQPLDELFSK